MARTVEEPTNGYDALRWGICKQAVRDYQKALNDIDKLEEKTQKTRRQEENVQEARGRIKEVQDFIRGEWYHALMPNLDGEKLISMVEKEHEEQKKMRAYKREQGKTEKEPKWP